MAVPENGTYRSEDGNFTLQITASNSDSGEISGTYEASYSPEGALSVTGGAIGHYSWVFNNGKGTDGVAPFNLSISVDVRPEGIQHCIYDRWAGVYQTDNSLLMEGCRSYVNSKGVVQATSLGTLRFSK